MDYLSQIDRLYGAPVVFRPRPAYKRYDDVSIITEKSINTRIFVLYRLLAAGLKSGAVIVILKRS